MADLCQDIALCGTGHRQQQLREWWTYDADSHASGEALVAMCLEPVVITFRILPADNENRDIPS